MASHPLNLRRPPTRTVSIAIVGVLSAALLAVLLATTAPREAAATWDWYNEQKIRATNGSAFDQFGISTAQQNGTIVVGAALDNGSRGSVYVYGPDGSGSWTEMQLTASDASAGDRFGYSVAVNNGVIVVGAPQANGQGAIYIYSPDGAGGYTEEKVAASDGSAGDAYGHSVDIDPSGIVVGARLDDHVVADAGSAYFYNAASAATTTAAAEQKIVAADADNNAQFGWSVAIDNGVVAIGAPHDSDAGYRAGAVYLYSVTAPGGPIEQKLIATDTEAGDQLGYAVDLANGVTVAGAPGDDDLGNNAGSATMFTTTASGVTQTLVTADDGSAGDEYGAAVSVSAGSVAIGAPRADVQAANTGAAYVFPIGDPTRIDKVFASDVVVTDHFFGFSVALDGDTLVTGATGDGDRGPKAGAAYIHDLAAGRTCNGKAVTVDLARGDSPTIYNDVILGTTGDDVITGLAGNDTICGGTGRDRIWGGAGDDTIFGGFDIDRIYGGSGRDTIHAGGGSDRVEGGPDDDVINGDSGADRILGSGGNDVINGGGGQDRIFGGSGDDTIQGSHQSDSLYGQDGNDILRGAKGKDLIYGGNGDDSMFGGDNTDYLAGGAGDDFADGQAGADNPLVAGTSGCVAETRRSC